MTDARGIITYANDIFCKMAEYELNEVIGQPHNILRHPDMPKVIFKLVWENILSGKNFYGFLKNRTKNGNYYWVKAFFQPIMKNGKIDKLISYRQTVNDYTKEVITPIYKKLIDLESTGGIMESEKFLNNYLKDRNITYREFIDRLSEEKDVTDAAALNIDYHSYYSDHIIFIEHVKHQCQLNNFDIEITDSCCCRFGIWLESVKHESYTNHSAWREVVNSHDHVHNKLKEFCNSMKTSNYTLGNKLLAEIEEYTYSIFNNLQKIIDKQ
jgi:PAS domain S-box-containing protein